MDELQDALADFEASMAELETAMESYRAAMTDFRDEMEAYGDIVDEAGSARTEPARTASTRGPTGRRAVTDGGRPGRADD